MQLDTPQCPKAFHSIFKTLDCVEASIGKTVEDFCGGKTAILITYVEESLAIAHGEMKFLFKSYRY